MLSREQMEEMWRTGPINALRNFSKNSRGKKTYKIRVIPYVTTELLEYCKTYEVLSKKQEDAIWEAKNLWYREHYDVNQTGIKVKVLA